MDRFNVITNAQTGEQTIEPIIGDLPPAPPPILNRAQWFLLLNTPDQSGVSLSMIMAAVIAAMPNGAQKAALMAVAYESETYSLPNAMGIVANMRAGGVSGLPTDADIESAWMQAAQFRGAQDLIGAA